MFVFFRCFVCCGLTPFSSISVASCGDIYLESIDDGVYGHRKLVDHEVNVVGKVRAYNNRLQMGHPSAEGKDNPDVAIAYAFMHYVCFDASVAELEETKIYNCLLPLCPRAEGIEPTCEGMNS